MAGLTITPVSKRKARSGNKNQNKQLDALENEPKAPAKPAPPKNQDTLSSEDPDKAAWLKRMKEREEARRRRS